MSCAQEVPRRALVVAAMAGETRGVRRRLGALRRVRWAGGIAWRGVFEVAQETEVWVAHCGMGQRKAEAWCQRALSMGVRFDAGLIVGIGGGLDPDLAPEELVEARVVVDGSGALQEIAVQEPQDSHGSSRAGGSKLGTVVTSPTLLLTARDKADLWQRVERPARAVVDMETHALCRGLAGVVRNVRCARVVSDGAAEDLPACLAHVADSRRGVFLAKILVGVVREPPMVGELLGLRRRLVAGAEALGEWVERQVVLDGR